MTKSDLFRASLVCAGVTALGPVVAGPTSLALVGKSADGQSSYQFYRDAVADRALKLEEIVSNLGPRAWGFHSGGLALVPPDHDVITAAPQYAGPR